MTHKPVISHAATTGEKGFTYRENIKRLNNAMRHEFYYEALLIDGALIEDRIQSLLYHLGTFDSRLDRKACKRTKTQLRAIQDQFLGEKNGLMVAMLSNKIDLVRATVLWYQSLEAAPADDPYLRALWNQYNSRIDTARLLSILARIDTWRAYRNEIIHGLMGKSIPALDEALPAQCHEGEELFRELDTFVRRLKYKNAIRRAAKLPTTEKA